MANTDAAALLLPLTILAQDGVPVLDADVKSQANAIGCGDLTVVREDERQPWPDQWNVPSPSRGNNAEQRHQWRYGDETPHLSAHALMST